MNVERELHLGEGPGRSEAIDLKFTRHGPVLHENTARTAPTR